MNKILSSGGKVIISTLMMKILGTTLECTKNLMKIDLASGQSRMLIFRKETMMMVSLKHKEMNEKA